MFTVGHIVGKFINQRKRGQRKIQLLLLSDNVHQLMTQREYFLKSFLKPKLITFKSFQRLNVSIIWKQLKSLLNPKVNVGNMNLKSGKTSIFLFSQSNLAINHPLSLPERNVIASDEDDINSFEIKEVEHLSN